jgi:hypothetical protein
MPEEFRRVARRVDSQARLAHPADPRKRQKSYFWTVQEIQDVLQVSLPPQ